MEQTIEDYEVAECIGKGSVASVYRATQRSTDREVALKILSSDLAESGAELVRLRRELLLNSQLTHPNLVRVFDGNCTVEPYFIAMELLPGGTLGQAVDRDGPMEEQQVLQIGSSIAEALALLHSQNIVHRDIKPSNILLAADGRAVLSDLGLARSDLCTALTSGGRIVGTVSYLAPELFEGNGSSPRSDLWSLGCVLYELLTAKPVIPAGDPSSIIARFRDILEGRLDSPRRIARSVSRDTSDLVMKLLSRDPSNRPESAERLVTAFRAPPKRSPSVVYSGPPAPIPPSPSKSLPAQSLVVLVAVIVAAPLFLRGRHQTQTLPQRPSQAPALDDASRHARSTFESWRKIADHLPELSGATGRVSSDLRGQVAMDLGDDVNVWIHWIELGRWLSTSPRPVSPPRPAVAVPGVMSPTEMFTMKKELQLDGSMPNIIATAVRWVTLRPDDGSCWLALAAALNWDGLWDESVCVGSIGLARNFESNLSYAPSAAWSGLVSTLYWKDRPRLLAQWPRWVRGDDAEESPAWQGLRTTLETADPALYQRLAGTRRSVPGR